MIHRGKGSIEAEVARPVALERRIELDIIRVLAHGFGPVIPAEAEIRFVYVVLVAHRITYGTEIPRSS